jgi:hypothetical protein
MDPGHNFGARNWILNPQFLAAILVIVRFLMTVYQPTKFELNF